MVNSPLRAGADEVIIDEEGQAVSDVVLLGLNAGFSYF